MLTSLWHWNVEKITGVTELGSKSCLDCVFQPLRGLCCCSYAGVFIRRTTTRTACVTPLRTLHTRYAPKNSSHGQL